MQHSTSLDEFNVFGDSFVRLADFSLRDGMGTSKENQRLPIHRWYRFPASFSHTFVRTALEHFGAGDSLPMLDPFSGVGTASVTARLAGRSSISIEAHPYLYQVGKTKNHWRVVPCSLGQSADAVCNSARKLLSQARAIVDVEPQIVRRCFTKTAIEKLVALRTSIEEAPHLHRPHLRLALADTLRLAAHVYVRSPYTAYGKKKRPVRSVFEEFRKKVYQMADDLEWARSQDAGASTVLADRDCRAVLSGLPDKSVGVCITSPPYLNNLDYAEITRLDTSFFGIATSWAELGKKVRSRLLTCTTTQVTRPDEPANTEVDLELAEVSPEVYFNVIRKVERLEKARETRSGAKSFDVVVARYFSEMLSVLTELHRVLYPRACAVITIGDSCLYGVYIPTDVYLGQMALDVGFSSFALEKLRERGGKWHGLPYRHSTKLRETVLIIQK